MSQLGPNTTLSSSARLLCFIGPPSAIIAVASASPKTALLTPLTYIPTAWAYHEWCKANTTNPSRRAQLEPLVWTYALSTTVGVAAVSAVQAGVGYTLTTLFYGTGEARSLIINEAMRNTTAGLSAETILQRAEIAKSWKYLSLMTLIFFTAAGVGEEVLKFLPVLYARRRGTAQDRKPRDRAYLDYVMASSLAFGVIEGIGFIFTACGKNGETGGKLALSVLERLLLGSTGHVLMAVLSALRATRRDYYGDKHLSWWRILAPSALIHGAFDVGALSFSAYEGNPGWIHPTNPSTVAAMLTVACSFWAGTAWLVRREFRLLAAYDRKKN